MISQLSFICFFLLFATAIFIQAVEILDESSPFNNDELTTKSLNFNLSNSTTNHTNIPTIAPSSSSKHHNDTTASPAVPSSPTAPTTPTTPTTPTVSPSITAPVVPTTPTSPNSPSSSPTTTNDNKPSPPTPNSNPTSKPTKRYTTNPTISPTITAHPTTTSHKNDHNKSHHGFGYYILQTMKWIFILAITVVLGFMIYQNWDQIYYYLMEILHRLRVGCEVCYEKIKIMIMKLIVKLNSLRRRSGGSSGGLGDDGDGSMLDGLLMGERE